MFVLVLVAMIPGVLGHGYLQEPPSRSSMWRFGFNTPHNYNDNQLFCGGFDVSVCNSTTAILSLDFFFYLFCLYTFYCFMNYRGNGTEMEENVAFVETLGMEFVKTRLVVAMQQEQSVGNTQKDK